MPAFARDHDETAVDRNQRSDPESCAWTERDLPYLAKGPTGMPMRTFVALAEAAQK